MPCTFELNPDIRWVVSRAHGNLTGEEMYAHLSSMRDLVAQGTIDGTWSQLIDFTNVTKLSVSTEDIRKISNDNPWPITSRRAIVAPGKEVFGLARMYALLSDGKAANVNLFQSLDEARAWLQSPPDETDTSTNA